MKAYFDLDEWLYYKLIEDNSGYLVNVTPEKLEEWKKIFESFEKAQDEIYKEIEKERKLNEKPK